MKEGHKRVLQIARANKFVQGENHFYLTSRLYFSSSQYADSDVVGHNILEISFENDSHEKIPVRFGNRPIGINS